MVPEEERSEIEKLEEEIQLLKSRIKNTEYDLKNMFKGNVLLDQKLKNSKKTLEEKHNILQQLRQQDPKKAEKFKELEENIEEKSTTSATEKQEEIIEQEIEKQFN
jgi:Tfp pilus assembly protein PilN